VRLLQKDAVPGHNGLVEREPRLGTVPVGEFPDRMVVRSPRARGDQAVKDGSFRVFQIGSRSTVLEVRLRFGFPCRHCVNTLTDLRRSRLTAGCSVSHS
jgi:hypothetical protein